MFQHVSEFLNAFIRIDLWFLQGIQDSHLLEHVEVHAQSAVGVRQIEFGGQKACAQGFLCVSDGVGQY